MLPTVLAFAVLNRARGTRLFGLVGSTTASRLAATLGMATFLPDVPAFLWAWGTLYLWSLPGWGKYAGAAVGAGLKTDETEFAPVDRVMASLPIRNPRVWGTAAMCLRMTLAAPCVVGVAYLTGGSAWWAALAPLMGLPYLPCGYALGPGKGWAAGEYFAGAILGLAVHMAAVAPGPQMMYPL